MAAKGKKSQSGRHGLGRYRLVVIAITLFWAALNEPPAFAAAPVIVWVLTALAVALLACTLLALLDPAILVLLRLFSRRRLQIKPEGDEA